VDEDIQPLSDKHRYQWDLRLDWQNNLAHPAKEFLEKRTSVESE
jgi:hypothetical protein